jgi:SAM-dependent methyltransferase
MHKQAHDFIKTHAERRTWDGAHILEIGSYNVNGSVRPLFAAAASYIGIDMRQGPGVEVVAAAAAYTAPAPCDLVVSTEAMEHCAAPSTIIACAWRSLAPGGVLLVTAAAPERTPHGSDGGGVQQGEDYTPISEDDLRRWLADWEDVQIEHHPERGDIYVAAVKPMPSTPRRTSKRVKE